MARMMMVSSDCHAMARTADYQPYIESKHRRAFDEWVGQLPSYHDALPAFFHEESLSQHDSHASVGPVARRDTGTSIGVSRSSKPTASSPR